MFKLRTGKKDLPYLGLIFGKPGCGKTTLVSHLPKAFFLGNEINKEFELQGFEPVDSWENFIKQIIEFKKYAKDYEHLVIDNITDMERMMINKIDSGKNLSIALGGFGAGYNECERRMRELIELLKDIQYSTNTNVIILGHSSEQSKIDSITSAEYTHYVPFLEKKSLMPIENHADFIFHLHRKIWTSTSGKKAFNSRVLYTSFSAGNYAKKKSYIDVPSEILYDEKNKTTLMLNLHEKIRKGLEGNDKTRPPQKEEFDSELEKAYNEAQEDSGKNLPPLNELLKKFTREQIMARANEIIVAKANEIAKKKLEKSIKNKREREEEFRENVRENYGEYINNNG